MLISASSGASHVALGFRPRSRPELERWRAQAWEDGTIEFATDDVLHPCPCCGFRRLLEPQRGSYDICDVCGWEDDPVQFDDPDYRGGANGDSFNEYRRDFAARYTAEFP